jgi:hypothetical protein
MKPRLCMAIAIGLAIVLLADSPASVSAQPVASIALPAPGATKQLYAGCNNISLTFPDGTPSQTVVQAVTPAGTVETLWRFNGALGRFEGFSPTYPQASDLASVNFLDAVWLCMTAAPPGAVAPPAAPVVDLAVTSIEADSLPHGRLYATVTNYGPTTLMTAEASLTCEAHGAPWDGQSQPVDSSRSQELTGIQLDIGQGQAFDTGVDIDANLYQYEVTCSVQADFYDPDTSNNTYTTVIPPS